jgi:spore coat protein U-like protein
MMLTAQAYGTASCSIASAATAFGNYNSLGSTNDPALGGVTITCTGSVNDPVNYTITLSSGQGSFSNRILEAGSAQLGYNLYLDSSHTTVWGDGTNGTSPLTGNFNLPYSPYSPTFTVYGQINGGQNSATASPGYADSLVVTLTY